MNAKQLQSEINAVTARLQQVMVLPLYTPDERARLVEKYTAELDALQGEYAIAALEIKVNNPVFLNNFSENRE